MSPFDHCLDLGERFFVFGWIESDTVQQGCDLFLISADFTKFLARVKTAFFISVGDK